MSQWFTRFANRASVLTGHYLTFLLAFALIVLWAVSGPVFHFSETWQLVINTGTTIITFLMVFLIQNTQNRDALAIHLKLDEIIHAIDAADDAIITVEDQTTEELVLLRKKYEALCNEHDELKARLGLPGANGARAAARR
ncbi:MAG: low affinity iron permease family protein [Thermomicrobiales bacterium]|nr:low affinity iron permease family protein [Thermomicrobiales bacterium]